MVLGSRYVLESGVYFGSMDGFGEWVMCGEWVGDGEWYIEPLELEQQRRT